MSRAVFKQNDESLYMCDSLVLIVISCAILSCIVFPDSFLIAAPLEVELVEDIVRAAYIYGGNGGTSALKC